MLSEPIYIAGDLGGEKERPRRFVQVSARCIELDSMDVVCDMYEPVDCILVRTIRGKLP